MGSGLSNVFLGAALSATFLTFNQNVELRSSLGHMETRVEARESELELERHENTQLEVKLSTCTMAREDTEALRAQKKDVEDNMNRLHRQLGALTGRLGAAEQALQGDEGDDPALRAEVEQLKHDVAKKKAELNVEEDQLTLVSTKLFKDEWVLLSEAVVARECDPLIAARRKEDCVTQTEAILQKYKPLAQTCWDEGRWVGAVERRSESFVGKGTVATLGNSRVRLCAETSP